MCLAIPARVTSIGDFNIAQVDIMGVTRKISLDLVPGVGTGDWVLVHAGFAIEVVDEAHANETLELLKELQIFQPEEA